MASNATFVTRGYGQVEPNHLSAPRNGQVYAQLPAAASIEQLENGQFVKYDYATGVCTTDASAKGPWMMVYNEVKIYRDRETDADFAMIKGNYNARVYSSVEQTGDKFTYPDMMPEGSTMVPRVFKISVGDIWTTNAITAAPGSLAQGTELKIGANGFLTVGEGAGGDADPRFVVVKVYTMPDMQPGVKVQCIG